MSVKSKLSKFIVRHKTKIIIGVIILILLIGGSIGYYFYTKNDDEPVSDQQMTGEKAQISIVDSNKPEEVNTQAISDATNGIGGSGLLAADTTNTEPGSAPASTEISTTAIDNPPPTVPSSTPTVIPETVSLTTGVRNEAYVSKTESVLLKDGKHICVNGVSYKVYAIHSGINLDTIYVRPQWVAGFSQVTAKLNDCEGAPWQPPPELPTTIGDDVTVASFNEYHKAHGYVQNFFGVGKNDAAKLQVGDKLCINGNDNIVEGFNTGLSMQITYVYITPNMTGTVKDGDKLRIGGC